MAWSSNWRNNAEKWFKEEQIPLVLRCAKRFIEEDDCSLLARVGTELSGIKVMDDNLLHSDKEENCTCPYGEESWQELKNKVNEGDKTLEERLINAFAAPMAFGTAGLRGKMGPGIACMNTYTIATATAGMAKYLLASYGEEECYTNGVVIGYDTRYHSSLFARTAAQVMAAYGIRVHLFPNYCSTPLLAYAIRPLGTLAGIMVTASHNPKVYNGYKVYGKDGIQIGSQAADGIAANIDEKYEIISYEEAKAKNLINDVSTIIERDYHEAVLAMLPRIGNEADLKIAYTRFMVREQNMFCPFYKRPAFKVSTPSRNK